MVWVPMYDWLTVVEEHGNDLLEILGKLLDRFPLTMRARETGDVTDIETGIGTALDHCGIGVHGLTCFQSTMVTDWYSRSGAISLQGHLTLSNPEGTKGSTR